MKSNEVKTKYYNKYLDYMQLIYIAGRGVMLTTQIIQYMSHFKGYNKNKVWEHLRDLENYELIDIHKAYNNSYVKLKKFPIRILQKKNMASDVKSITYNKTLLIRSTYINARFLKDMESLEGENIYDFLLNAMNTTTFFSKEKKGYRVFVPFYKKNEEVTIEMVRLDRIAHQKPADTNVFGLNNMASRNIYISSIQESYISIEILDLTGTLNSKRIRELVELTYTYLSTLFPKAYIEFCFMARDKEHEDSLNSSLEKVKKQGLPFLSNITLATENLDITSKCFSNIKIL